MRVMFGLVVIALVCFGCSRHPDIVVVDQQGVPLTGVIITGTSLSIGGATSSTNARGHATIPWSIQKTICLLYTSDAADE